MGRLRPDGEGVFTFGAVGVNRHDVPADPIAPRGEWRDDEDELLVISRSSGGWSGRDRPAIAGGEPGAWKGRLDAFAGGEPDFFRRGWERTGNRRHRLI